jgi:hypothetical protein
MKKLVLIFSLFASPAFAQQVLPIMLDAQTYQQLRQYLGQQPHDVVAPVVNLLTQLQQQAQQAASQPPAKPDKD